MRRVSVIGSPGAGKTVFSGELARKAGLPLIHLDRIYHDQEYSYASDRKSWRDRVQAEIDKPRWLIDGNYKSTFDIRLPASDTIIFLDYPTYISLWRAIKRRIQYRSSVRHDMPATWQEKLGWDFFVFILRFNITIAPMMRKMLRQFDDKGVIILRSPAEAEQYLAELTV